MLTSQHVHAGSLAGLLMAMPVGLALWAIVASRRVAIFDPRRSLDSAQLGPWVSWVRWSERMYFGGLGLSVFFVAARLVQSDYGAKTEIRALVAYLFVAGLAAVAPWRQIYGPLAFLVISYALPREDAVTQALNSAGAISILTVLNVAGLVVTWIRIRHVPSPPQTTVLWALLAFSFWAGVVVFAAMWNGHPISDDLCHRTARIAQTIILCLTAYYARPSLTEVKFFVAALAFMLIARAVCFTETLRLEQNLAALIVITVPWTAALALTKGKWFVRLCGGAGTLCLIGLVGLIANRGAFLGLAGASLAVWAVARWKWRVVAACIPGFLLLALLLPHTNVGRRIDQAYAQGTMDETTYNRLELWGFGVDLAQQNPLFGVGPENYAHYLSAAYETVGTSFGAHNIFVDVLAEMGFPGLVLFIAFWCFTSISLFEAGTSLPRDSASLFVVGSLASAWAYLITGTFLSIASLAYIYTLVGISLGLMTQTRSTVTQLDRTTKTQDARGDNRRFLGRSAWDFATLIYATAVVIGSLTPFETQTVGLAEAGRRFLDLSWRSPDFSSRVDAVSNIVLFAPLGFLFMGSLTADVASPTRRLGAAALVLLGAIGFGACLEYLQCWFPNRTTSANDVAAQLIGAIIGVGSWLALGQKCVERWRQWRISRADLSAFQQLILWYAAGLVLWWCWPVELSLHPVDLYHKYRDGLLGPMFLAFYSTPLVGGPSSPAARLLLVAPIGWWLSSAWLRSLECRRSWRHILFLAAAAAVGLEMMRLMSKGQIASGDQLLVSFLGVVLGGWVHRGCSCASPVKSSRAQMA
jgi:O-antigen ligase/VanZ family protein